MPFDEKSKNPFRSQPQGFFPPSASGAAEEFHSGSPVPQAETQFLSQDDGNSRQLWNEPGKESGSAQTAQSYHPPPGPPSYIDSNSSFSHKPNFSYNSFLPVYLIANGKSLSSGFPNVPPPSSPGMPHPFETHDVNERDWTNFLGEIASLGDGQHAQTHSSGRGLAKIFETISQTLTTPAAAPAGQLVDQWNNHFFHPRKMEVILAQGWARLSGPRDRGLPNLNWEQERAHRQRSGSRSSSSSSSSDDERHSHGSSHHTLVGGRRARRAERLEYRLERREDRQKRRAQRREVKLARLGLGGKSDPQKTDGKYRLFVVSL